MLEMSNDNSFVKALLNEVNNEQWHTRNNDSKTHNAILDTKNKWQKDKKPAEEMTKATLDTFC